MTRNFGLATKPATFKWRRYKVVVRGDFTHRLTMIDRIWERQFLTLSGARAFRDSTGVEAHLYEWGGHGWFERM